MLTFDPDMMLGWRMRFALIASRPRAPESRTTPLFDEAGDDFYASFRTTCAATTSARRPRCVSGEQPAVLTYRDVIAQKLDGFGMNEAIYAVHSRRSDEPARSAASMMPARQSTSSTSRRCLRVPPAHADRGQLPRRLARTMGPNSLVARPYPGFGLSRNTYALSSRSACAT
jgi:hypothetical protein